MRRDLTHTICTWSETGNLVDLSALGIYTTAMIGATPTGLGGNWLETGPEGSRHQGPYLSM